MYDLTGFSLSQMIECGSTIRRLGAEAESLEQASARIVRFLYEHLGDPRTRSRSCALVRFFQSCPLGDLDPDRRAAALAQLGPGPHPDDLKCLVLTASVGDRPEWNDPRDSACHRVIPLPGVERLRAVPMIARLVEQFGLEPHSWLNPDPDFFVDLEQRNYNVFHVPEAPGSPYIPAQAGFVIPHAIRSVLGFGGLLPANELFAVILFARDPIPRPTADLFRPLALSVKLAVLPFALRAGPAAGPAGAPTPDAESTDALRPQIGAFLQQLDVLERAALEQAARLEQALAALHGRTEALERSDRELRDRTEVLRAVLDSMAEPVIVTDESGRCRLANPAAAQVFELDPAPDRCDLARARAQLFRPGSDDPVSPADLPWARPLREPAAEEFQVARSDGTRLTVDLTVRPVVDDRGRPRGRVLVGHDITERKRAEADLARFKFLSDNANDAFFFMDRDSRILYVNRVACERLGYTEAELLQRGVPDIDPNWDLDRYRESFDRSQQCAVPPFETFHSRRDGSLIPVEISVAGVRFGGVPYAFAACRDITHRKRSDEAIHRSEQMHRLLTEGTLDAIVVADAAGTIRHFNPSAQRTFGYTEAEALGQPLLILMPEEYHADHQDAVRRYVDTREARLVGRTIELRARRKSGEIFPVEVSLSAIDLPEGVVLLGAIRDITDRYKLQARILQAEKLASLGLLSAGLAHEINNPLAYVGSNLAVLDRYLRQLLGLVECVVQARSELAAARPELTERLDRQAADIDLAYIRESLPTILTSTRGGVRRIADIVQNLRGFARLDQAIVEPIDLRQPVLSSLELIRERLRRRHIEVVEEFADLPPVVCEPAQINQVALNLLVNAMQAIEQTGRGHGRIVARTRRAGAEALIEVEDDGTGIAPEDQKRIFDPFFTTKPVGQGTGLGLSITHGIVTSHGGRIELDSRPGQGTTFRVILPINGRRSPT